MIRTISWALAILGILVLLQTTLLSHLVFLGVKPDIVLVVFVVLATHNGSLSSQIVGFILGLILDMVSLAPLGFHAFLYSLAGYFFGLGSGKVYLDPLVMPALLGLLATIYYVVTAFLISLVFRLADPWSSWFNVGLFVQLSINVFLTPLVYWIQGWIREKFQNPRRGFGG
jgi:rod shape-determining protein MreD